MAGQKQIGWNKLVAAVFFTALFVATALIGFVPKALAATGPFEFEQDSGTIFRLAGDATFTNTTAAPLTYTQTGIDFSHGTTTCPIVLTFPAGTTIDVNKDTSATEHVYGYDGGAGVPDAQRCSVPANQQSSATVTVAAYNIDDQPTGAPGGTTDPNLDCGTKLNPLNWFICPIITTLVNQAVGQLDNLINNLLTVDQNKIFNTSTDTGAGYYKAWQTFRALSLGLLVIAGLFMVISQALGFEVLDAYTIKKVLPRLVLAILGIALSWQLMQFFVVLTNDLGNGIRSIIYFPFQAIIQKTPLVLGGGASFATLILGGGAFAALGIAGLLSFVLTGALALLVAFLVLILRQLIIIVLILFAPIAIACSILPNTQSVYKLWWESFSKAMLMFPIIVAFLAVGRVFAVTSIGANIGKASFISQLIGFAAYFLPYFLIPKTFSLAGGALRTIGGSVNDRSRGGFDRLKKYRAGRIQTNTDAMKSGNRIKSDNWAAKKFNATTAVVAGAPHAGLNPTKMADRLHSYQRNHGILSANEAIEKNAAFQAIKGNDDFLQAGVMGKGNDAAVKAELIKRGYSEESARAATADIRAARRSMPSEAFDTAAALALPATGTFAKDGAGQMNELVHEVAGEDDVKAARMIAQMRGGFSQARRFDISGGGYNDQLQTYYAQKNKENAIRGNSNLSAEEKERQLEAASHEASQHIFESALEGQGGSYVAGMRRNGVANVAPVMLRTLNNNILDSNGQYDEIGTKRELAVIAGRYDAMASVAPENARIMADNVMGQTLTSASRLSQFNNPNTGTTMTVQQMIEHFRDDPNFVNMRREYSANASRSGFAAMQQGQQQLPGQTGQPDPGQIGPLK